MSKEYLFSDLDALQEIVSEEFGPWSNEIEVTQELVNQFAEMTGDDYWMHTDPEKCKTDSPFGGTIAHGFLTLVLLPKMRNDYEWEVTGFNNMLNYGSNKLRFTGPVPVGSNIHARSRVKSVEQTPKGQTCVTLENHICVVGQERPAVVYELMFMYM
jgi:acyl dehydratase